MNMQQMEQDRGYELGTLDELDAARRSRRPRVRRIPYDYVAKFRLTGVPGTTVPTAVNISAEAWFICSSIGYSLEEPEPVPPPTQAAPPQRVATRFPALLQTRNLLTTSDITNAIGGIATVTDKVNAAQAAEQLTALQIQNLRESLSFTYAIIDKGSGRELQNEPIHNLAGLGKPDGVRPFRELVVPYVFAPNSSIVIELREITTIAGGTVHIVFQGYKEFR